MAKGKQLSLTAAHKNAVTLLELMVVIIIVGILASIAVPMFGKAIEGTKANEAVAGLEQIRTGQRIYRVEENTYWGSSTGGGIVEIKQINDKLRTFVDFKVNRHWDYDVVLTNSMEFTGKATKIGGIYNGGTISIDQNGDLTAGDGWPAELVPK